MPQQKLQAVSRASSSPAPSSKVASGADREARITLRSSGMTPRGATRKRPVARHKTGCSFTQHSTTPAASPGNPDSSKMTGALVLDAV